MPGIRKPRCKAVSYVPGKGIIAGMGVYNEYFHDVLYLQLVECDMFFLHGNFTCMVSELDGFFLVRQERMVQVKTKNLFNFFKGKFQYRAAVLLKMLP
jgi:hypothetical protein